MRQGEVTRRSFVAGTAGAAFGAMVVPRHVLGGAGYLPPSETVNVAIVGCGGQGASDAAEILAGGQNIVALADVDFGYVDSAMAGRTKGRNGRPNPTAVKLQEAYGKAKRYDDYRKMLEEQKDIDGVVVATPDHTHAVVAKAAMELGKHVYVEKPLDLVGPRGPRAARDGPAHQGRHPDGQPGPLQRGRGAHQRMDPRRRDRPGEGGPCLDQSPDLAAGHSASGKARRRQCRARGGRGGGFGNEWTSRRLNRDDRDGHQRR